MDGVKTPELFVTIALDAVSASSFETEIEAEALMSELTITPVPIAATPDVEIVTSPDRVCDTGTFEVLPIQTLPDANELGWTIPFPLLGMYLRVPLIVHTPSVTAANNCTVDPVTTMFSVTGEVSP